MEKYTSYYKETVLVTIVTMIACVFFAFMPHTMVYMMISIFSGAMAFVFIMILWTMLDEEKYSPYAPGLEVYALQRIKTAGCDFPTMMGDRGIITESNDVFIKVAFSPFRKYTFTKDEFDSYLAITGDYIFYNLDSYDRKGTD